ncbi:MAG: NifB/NifX family molybdenum-iron cluster-binding protein [bacterium]
MKVLITIWHEDVAPRFDLASEVLTADVDPENGEVKGKKTLVLPAPSAEELCRFILSEGIETVICGGIENEYYQFLAWKNIKVIDSVIGSYEKALELLGGGELEAGTIFKEREE